MPDPKLNMALPAPRWRRLASAFYDALLLLGIWMGTAMIYVPIRDFLGRDALGTGNSALPAFLFLTGLAFIGWSWTHGGATPGMLAWHLQVRRDDGSGLRWPIAAVRYAVMLTSWGIGLTPLLLLLPARVLVQMPKPFAVAAAAAALTLSGLLLCLRDPRRRAPCDRLTGTEVVVLVKRS